MVSKINQKSIILNPFRAPYKHGFGGENGGPKGDRKGVSKSEGIGARELPMRGWWARMAAWRQNFFKKYLEIDFHRSQDNCEDEKEACEDILKTFRSKKKQVWAHSENH